MLLVLIKINVHLFTQYASHLKLLLWSTELKLPSKVQFKETKLYTFLIIIKSFGAIKSGVCVEFGSTSATAVKC